MTGLPFTDVNAKGKDGQYDKKDRHNDKESSNQRRGGKILHRSEQEEELG
jgi:hypothetical protein